jgi:hypothetical protein
MPVLKVKLIGRGKDGDPYRASLPTYNHLHGNVAQGFAIVYVPDELLGLTSDELAALPSEETTEGRQLKGIPPGVLDKIHTHWDNEYPARKGEFRIEEV